MKIKILSVQNMDRRSTNNCSIILLQAFNNHSTKRRARMTPEEAKKLISQLTYSEKCALIEMLKSLEQTHRPSPVPLLKVGKDD